LQRRGDRRRHHVAAGGRGSRFGDQRPGGDRGGAGAVPAGEDGRPPLTAGGAGAPGAPRAPRRCPRRPGAVKRS
jgi:hypothetical protein